MRLDPAYVTIGALAGSVTMLALIASRGLRLVPATHVSGGRIRPGQRVLLIVRLTDDGPRKLGAVPCPWRLWERLNR